MSQFALAWTLANKDVNCVLNGFTRKEQLDENFDAVQFSKEWTKELDMKVEDILGNAPEKDIDWRYFKPLPMRRDETV
jgi:aryl-alcohol dehydrogenase-like predicted oxidoreductase